MALRGRSMKQRRGDRNVTWREAMDVPSLALSGSQPPRRAAPRCFASRHDGGIRNLKLKSCVDSHAFRDEGRFQLNPDGLGFVQNKYGWNPLLAFTERWRAPIGDRDRLGLAIHHYQLRSGSGI